MQAEHLIDEISKVKSIFHESREDFAAQYNKLHLDFSNRVGQMYVQITKVDEVRNLYER